ncbi:HTTM domain-containing protein [Aeoliella mucimassa]|uniref:Vitamin K-dependent gamma-carboxylase n=1 Tax=Aeoliella mucimassa TaxID=2527972 RepID=A0A518AN31_9BACT|nr:HTTM domain-containing protein [Aeoliella mucimassa]QDU56135.1 Vitamin K-dependent gamma-carboxylase [Aeoliella mucimassa]
MGSRRTKPTHSPPMLDRLEQLFSKPVDGASLAVFRICFGLIMAWHIASYLIPGDGIRKLDFYYVDAVWNFSYMGFEWVRPWAEPWLTIHFVVASIAAIFVAVGLYYRAASITLFLSYTYFFLLEATNYNNHYYLMCLLAMLLSCMPATRRFSLDNLRAARRVRAADASPSPVDGLIPFWPVLLLRFQIFLVYFYGGIAKLNSDWLTGEPLLAPGDMLYTFLDSTIGLPNSLQVNHVCLMLAWGGLFYDLSVGLLLLWKRTRWIAIGLTFLFHLHNHFIFPIGVFPVMAFTSTLIFFPTDWPIQATRWLRCKATRQPVAANSLPKPQPRLRVSRVAVGLICLFVVWQSTWPLRHYFVAGDANWTEECQDFSWRMMLRAKAAGFLVYRVTDPDLQIVDSEDRSQIDWDACPAGTPKAVYASVDSHLFNWNHHPGMSTIYEPALGIRVIYTPTAAESSAIDLVEANKAKITERWQAAFNSEPEIEESISLNEAIAEIRQRIESPEVRRQFHPSTIAQLVGWIDELATAVTEQQKAEASSEAFQVAVTGALDRLSRSQLYSIVRPTLERLHPFALQGGVYSEKRFLVIRDSNRSVDLDDQALLALSHGEPYLVWVDFSRLRPVDWRGLPKSMVTFEDRMLNVVWNHFHDIHSQQLEKFTVRPYLIRQYARHIADCWEESTGRRPEVQASSYIMLNYYFPRPLVDPEVDLAKVAYDPLHHNDWILPRATHRIDLSNLPRSRH